MGMGLLHPPFVPTPLHGPKTAPPTPQKKKEKKITARCSQLWSQEGDAGVRIGVFTALDPQQPWPNSAHH